MPTILGNAVAILSSSLAGASEIDILIASLCTRATEFGIGCENKVCTANTLKSFQNCP